MQLGRGRQTGRARLACSFSLHFLLVEPRFSTNTSYFVLRCTLIFRRALVGAFINGATITFATFRFSSHTIYFARHIHFFDRLWRVRAVTWVYMILCNFQALGVQNLPSRSTYFWAGEQMFTHYSKIINPPYTIVTDLIVIIIVNTQFTFGRILKTITPFSKMPRTRSSVAC